MIYGEWECKDIGLHYWTKTHKQRQVNIFNLNFRHVLVCLLVLTSTTSTRLCIILGIGNHYHQLHLELQPIRNRILDEWLTRERKAKEEIKIRFDASRQFQLAV